ncbi:hypothetical protein IAQ61_007739 [Plenodomus lingam]|uniref:uncharacterized protein n=1 Tax=Leptosphaeria maculans TaxID=5022 RepID=UPI0033175A93|nr:hypothetical protein IAQ61_007739 [Plenodomus lingam]
MWCEGRCGVGYKCEDGTASPLSTVPTYLASSGWWDDEKKGEELASEFRITQYVVGSGHDDAESRPQASQDRASVCSVPWRGRRRELPIRLPDVARQTRDKFPNPA